MIYFVMLKFIFSTLIALSLLVSVFVVPAAADGAENDKECKEFVTVKKTITETGAYGQQTTREVEEKRCKIEVAELPAAGIDPVTAVALTGIISTSVGAFALKRKLG